MEETSHDEEDMTRLANISSARKLTLTAISSANLWDLLPTYTMFLMPQGNFEIQYNTKYGEKQIRGKQEDRKKKK